jgi:hypothetical protein
MIACCSLLIQLPIDGVSEPLAVRLVKLPKNGNAMHKGFIAPPPGIASNSLGLM